VFGAFGDKTKLLEPTADFSAGIPKRLRQLCTIFMLLTKGPDVTQDQIPSQPKATSPPQNKK
jgi:hypothetical protein